VTLDIWIHKSMLAPSKGTNRVDVSLHSPEDGNSFIFRSVMISTRSYLEFWAMD
jgi:hypothetical protein